MTSHRGRRALLLGLVLAGSLWFGLIRAVVRLHSHHGPLVGNVDPRLVDVGILALNVALLVSFVIVHRSRRLRRPSGLDEASG